MNCDNKACILVIDGVLQVRGHLVAVGLVWGTKDEQKVIHFTA